MKTAKFSILVVLLIATTSCMFDGFGIKGNRNVVTEDRKISAEFSEIKASHGINVYLTQGTPTDLHVEADENIIDLLVTEVEGNTLKIYFDKNVSRAKARNVYVTADELTYLKATSGSEIRSEGTIRAKNLKLSSNSGAELVLAINATEVTCSTSSGAHAKLTGTTKSFAGDASSGSQIDADDLTSQKATAGVSSGADISLHASEELDARASSGGHISFEGNPAVLNKSKSSGGSISKR
ncbi:MAG: hypothetical protein BM563_04380 [Bacteroidetes bacterium MedPE-SWsnd-G1]|nr:MAG: hypothetical protein BM563_04380 [Bacteroidetes bacterium MedPE-SWsnd-G1]